MKHIKTFKQINEHNLIPDQIVNYNGKDYKFARYAELSNMIFIEDIETGERKMIDKRDLTDKNLSESNNENKFIEYQGNYYNTKKIHIDLLRVGDTILHNGEIKTVSSDYLKRGGFAGTTVFGDSYHSGNKKVTLIEFTEHPIVVNGHSYKK